MSHPAPHATTRPRRHRSLRALIPFLAALTFAAWAWTRSEALTQAKARADRARSPEALAHVVRLATDHLDRQPWNTDAARLAAVCLSRLDQPDAAEPYYRRAGRLALEDRHTRAYALVRANRRDDAIATYHDIITSYPENADALRLLGGLYYSRKQYGEAIDAARRLSKVADPFAAAEGHRLLGTIFQENGDPTGAAAELLQVARIDPDRSRMPPEARFPFETKLALSLLATGQAQEAAGQLETALSHADDSLLRTLLGRARLQLGDLDAAETEWRHALALDPKHGPAWLDLGRLALARNQPEAALDALNRAAALAPSDYEVLYALRTAHARQGHTDEVARLTRRIENLRGKATPAPGGMGPRMLPAG